ncbi:hypothetical protein [Pseudoalteromonas piscicida]|uniref:hypothetical protein n=1 Tax=Pseudoalteromonas piscicida TaxID=43662 RepID=UPI001C9849B7|nr:hypothetical protein [Pseudoalteromonas piscicida]QZO12314.1 hypothetical protein K5642_14575 [Pseudoalteromonas piscicida]
MSTEFYNSHTSGIKKYCDLLEEVKLRIKTVQAIVKKEVPEQPFGCTNFSEEFVFLQVRKILELIAFGSMASNISVYEKAHSDYQNNWRTKNILKRLEDLNKDFYPLPLKEVETQEGNRALVNVQDGYLTKNDLVFLYDVSSKVIHAPNPYAEARKIDLKMSIDDWMHRIASLLWFHQIKLVDSNVSWLVYLIHPETKKSQAIQLAHANNS